MTLAAPAHSGRRRASRPWCCAHTARCGGPCCLLAAAAAHRADGRCAGSTGRRRCSDGWLGLDDARLLFLSITSVLFLAAAVYAVGYLRREAPRANTDFEEGGLFTQRARGRLHRLPAAVPGHDDAGGAVSHHFGLLWVGVEATTLASAPLIYFHRHHRIARGHLEVPADLLGRHRPGPAGQLLPRGGRHGLGATRAPDDRATSRRTPAVWTPSG